MVFEIIQYVDKIQPNLAFKHFLFEIFKTKYIKNIHRTSRNSYSIKLTVFLNYIFNRVTKKGKNYLKDHDGRLKGITTTYLYTA